MQQRPFVRRNAGTRVPVEERERFVEIVENQLMNLHEGSIARYRLRPSEFLAWRKRWA